MAEYPRKRGSDTWHCRNCSGDPKNDYVSRTNRPDFDLCNECKGKEAAGTCNT